MEADWEVEIGPDAPVIDPHWPGLVDLQQNPTSARQLPEVALLPDLDQALVRLNAVSSPVWTSKCDVWPLNTHEFDADEMDAPPESASYGWGCYIDLLPLSDQQWAAPVMAIAWCKDICGLLHEIPLACGRVDLIVRQASLTPGNLDNEMRIGITVYLTSCGATSQEANQVLQAVLGRFVDTLGAQSTIE